MSKLPSLDDMTRADIEQLFARADADKPSGANPSIPPALLDLYTIRRDKGTLDGLRVALLGNLVSDERAQSLARLLGRFDMQLSFVSPAALSMPPEVSDELRAAGLEVEETNDLATTLARTDVLYLVRLDPQRVPARVYARFKDFYSITPAIFENAKPGLLVLGEWDGAEQLLAPVRVRSEQYRGALAKAL